jgi:2-(1,2-epoxy-1,2-dihydrophenyl)acetyl-CoA isomerase
MSARTHSKLAVDSPLPGVLRVLINRPEKRNAIDHDVREQLTAVFSGLGGAGAAATTMTTPYRSVVLGGVGGHFSAGGDLPSMVGLDDDAARARMRHIARLCCLVEATRIPVVTAMQGFSAGACVGLALLGDHVVVGPDTKILFPFLKLALVPDWGLLYTLPRRVGYRAARRMLLSGATLTGPEAAAIGVADDCAGTGTDAGAGTGTGTDAGAVMALALARAAELAALPQSAYACLKHRLTRPSRSFEEELAREEEDQAGLLQGADFREGYAAFVEKRVPDFVARAGEPP